MAGVDKSQESFLDAVVKGVFTVPGDGDIDFGKIVRAWRPIIMKAGLL